MKVSFVTVCYKTPELIRSLLRGVEQAKFSFPFEYFLVNNNPGDGMGEIVREEFPWVTYVDAPGNVGFAAGNNLAFRLAKGEYVMCVNPDLTIFPGEMEKLLAFADANPQYGIIGPRLLNPNRTVQSNYHRFPSPLMPVYRRTVLGATSYGQKKVREYFMHDVDASVPIEVDGLFGAALLIRRDALGQFGHFDEGYFMYFEDIDLCRRAWEAGWKVCYAPVAEFVHYHQRESGVKWPWLAVLNPLTRAHIASAVRYFWKYRRKPLPRGKAA